MDRSGYQPNSLQIEQADLPLDAQVGELDLTLIPGRRSGVFVDLQVKRASSAEFRLVNEQGEPLVPGTVLTIGTSSLPVKGTMI